MRKSSFLTFCFAFIPGAGQMYLGMMKKGTAIMALFAALSFLSGFLNLGVLLAALPVIWFYSFFDTFNLKQYSYQQLLTLDDIFVQKMGRMLHTDFRALLSRRHVLFGVILIFVGAYAIFSRFVEPFLSLLYETAPWLYRLVRSFPTLVVSLAVIALGVCLVRGKRTQNVLPDHDYQEYRPGEEEQK